MASSEEEDDAKKKMFLGDLFGEIISNSEDLHDVFVPKRSEFLRTPEILIAEGMLGEGPDLNPLADKILNDEINYRERLYIYALLKGELDWRITRRTKRGIKSSTTDMRILVEISKSRAKGVSIEEAFSELPKILHTAEKTLRRRYYSIPLKFRSIVGIERYEEIADLPYFQDLKKHIAAARLFEAPQGSVAEALGVKDS